MGTEIKDIIARAICESGDYGRPELLDETAHRGDCTKEAFTCAVCLGDEIREMRDAVLKALHDAGYWVAPREITEEMLAASWATSKTQSPDEYMSVALSPPRGAHDIKMQQRYQAVRDAWEKESS